MASARQRRRTALAFSAMTSALEALEDGNPLEAMAILRSALEDSPAQADRPHSCPLCPGLSFEWPGLLQHHLDVSHPPETEWLADWLRAA